MATPLVLTMLDRERRGDPDSRRPGSFEYLVRHLLTRLIASESLGGGDEMATRIPQIAAAVAMPGVVLAIFLYPLYHYPFAPRAFWSQVSDHLFYTIYSFVFMGLGTVLQWELLFPDRLDALILTTLPIPNTRLLLARIAALTIFLGAILLGTNLLGILAMPMSADLLHIGLAHFKAHALAVLLSGLGAAAFLVALQGLLVSLLGEELARKLSPIVQTLCVLLLLTTLFLYPLLAHFLPTILQSHRALVFWFPPFWSLGLYERLLWGPSAPAIFFRLGHTGILFTVISGALALLSYPIAFQRRTRQIIEGVTVRRVGQRPRVLQNVFRNVSLWAPEQRAIFCFISQTLMRIQRTRLLLAIFGGLALSTVICAVTLVDVGGHGTSFKLSRLGLRFALPIVACWAVIGLRTASRVLVTRNAAWIFRAIHGRAARPHLFATEWWVAIAGCAILVTVTAISQMLAPQAIWSARFLTQMLVAISLPILLTDLLFFSERSIPFTVARPYSVNDLSWVVATYLGFFPLVCAAVVTAEPWIERGPVELVITAAGVLVTHFALRSIRLRSLTELALRGEQMDGHLAPGEIGLRD